VNSSKEDLPRVRSLPTLDSHQFWILTEQTGHTVAERFFNDYLDLLPIRLANIMAGLAAKDRERTLDAIVSLRASSSMAGALEMEASARTLERQLRLGQWAETAAVKAELSENILHILSEAQSEGRISP
jgi:hypothetical protein